VLIALNKPFGVVCKFRREAGRRTLADHVDVRGVYPAGRLDTDSEGLLLLTDDGALQARISNPRHELAKVYWAQVENVPTEDALATLRRGVDLGDFVTRPAHARLIDEPEIRFVHERGGLERVTGLLEGQLAVGERVELIVHERDQSIHRFPITGACLMKDLGNGRGCIGAGAVGVRHVGRASVNREAVVSRRRRHDTNTRPARQDNFSHGRPALPCSARRAYVGVECGGDAACLHLPSRVRIAP